jgi:hypothetical protein
MSRPEHIPEVEPPTADVRRAEMIDSGIRGKQDPIAQSADPKEDVCVFPDPAYTEEVVSEAAKVPENMLPKRHIGTNTVSDVNLMARVRSEEAR